MDHGHCIHWTGLRPGPNGEPARCAAGFIYEQAFGKAPGIFGRLPCIQYNTRPVGKAGTYVPPGWPEVRVEHDRYGQKMIPCGAYIEPSDEQVQQDRRETEASIRKTMAAIAVASQWRVQPKPAKARAEVVPCPICQGRLHLSQSAHNGHVHGQCETPECVSWME